MRDAAPLAAAAEEPQAGGRCSPPSRREMLTPQPGWEMLTLGGTGMLLSQSSVAAMSFSW